MIIWFVLAVLTVIPVFFFPHFFLTLYNFGLLWYNYKYFARCLEARGTHFHKLVQVYPTAVRDFYRGSMVTHQYENGKN
jgi:hypothetical protein